jgi:hypothetical protein
MNGPMLSIPSSAAPATSAVTVHASGPAPVLAFPRRRLKASDTTTVARWDRPTGANTLSPLTCTNVANVCVGLRQRIRKGPTVVFCDGLNRV